MKAGFLDEADRAPPHLGRKTSRHHLLQLAQEKGLIETVFNAIQGGIIATDAKGRISDVNDAACGSLGSEAESLDPFSPSMSGCAGLMGNRCAIGAAPSAATWRFLSGKPVS